MVVDDDDNEVDGDDQWATMMVTARRVKTTMTMTMVAMMTTATMMAMAMVR